VTGDAEPTPAGVFVLMRTRATGMEEVRRGDRVQIHAGVFAGREGTVEHTDPDAGLARVRLELVPGAAVTILEYLTRLRPLGGSEGSPTQGGCLFLEGGTLVSCPGCQRQLQGRGDAKTAVKGDQG
jgi:hypothetical protein